MARRRAAGEVPAAPFSSHIIIGNHHVLRAAAASISPPASAIAMRATPVSRCNRVIPMPGPVRSATMRPALSSRSTPIMTPRRPGQER